MPVGDGKCEARSGKCAWHSAGVRATTMMSACVWAWVRGGRGDKQQAAGALMLMLIEVADVEYRLALLAASVTLADSAAAASKLWLRPVQRAPRYARQVSVIPKLDLIIPTTSCVQDEV
jgi:hypothetical protein